MAPDFRKPFRAMTFRNRPVPAGGLPETAQVVAPARSSLVNDVIYEDGVRVETLDSLDTTFAVLEARPGAMAWIGLYRPTTAEITSLADQFGLHELAVEDAILAHQRPEIERYGSTLFVVLRAARYLDAKEEVEFGELHLFIG